MAVGHYGAALIALLGVGLCAAIFKSDASSFHVPLGGIGKVCSDLKKMALLQ